MKMLFWLLSALLLTGVSTGPAQAHLPPGENCRAHNLGVELTPYVGGTSIFVASGHGSCIRHAIVQHQSTAYVQYGSSWHYRSESCESRGCGVPEYYAESGLVAYCYPFLRTGTGARSTASGCTIPPVA